MSDEKPVVDKIKLGAMDVIRATDAASKKALAAATRDGFDNFISRLGLNNDNALSASTYEFNLVTRNRLLLEAAYRGAWVVGRAVDSVAEDMTRAGIDITTSEGEKDLKQFNRNWKRLKLWQSISSGIKWGRLYGGGLGVYQIEGQDLATPLAIDSVGQDQFKGLAIYDRWQLNPMFNSSISSGPDIGLPEFYQIVTPSNSGAVPVSNIDPQSGYIKVHYSRVIRFTGYELPFFQAITEQMWGESVLERLWDRLISFDNATLSAASLIDRANLRTVGVDRLREIIAAGGEAMAGLQAMFEMMRLMQVNEGLTLLDKEDVYTSTAYSFAGLSDMLLQFSQQVSGALGIPLVVLFSQTPSGLNSTAADDLRLYYDGINSQQEAKLSSGVDALIKILWRSTFGRPCPEDLEFTFKSLWQMTALDKSTIAKTNTETVLGAYEAGLISAAAAMQELRGISGDTGLFSNITDEDIASAESEPAPIPDAPDGQQGEVADPGAAGEGPIKNLDSNPWKRMGKWLSGK